MNSSPKQGAGLEVLFTVGDWHVDASANEIRRDSGDAVKLEPKVMDVLRLLASRPGKVVTREELEAHAWSQTVVTTDAVTGAIIKLRRALGDEARSPRYIETLSKSGYRLIAEVGHGVQESSTPKSAEIIRWQRTLRSLLLLPVIIVAALWLVFIRDDTPPPETAVRAPAAVREPGIAVLPFENIGAVPEHDYFTHGITDDLTTDLSKLPGLWVVARDSVMIYKGSAENAKTIARELGVDYLLRGSVRRSSGRIRINVTLIDGKRATNIWGQRYDRRIDDIFEVQDEIAANVLSALEVEMAPADRSRMTRNRLANVLAYDEFLRGLDLFGRRSLPDNELARQHYQRAIEIDSGFARAYVGLALVYTSELVNGWDPTKCDALLRAAVLTEMARILDPSIPQIYFVEGLIELFQGNFDAAIRDVEHAIAIKPSYADAYALLAWTLHFAGRPAKGLASMKHAVRLNPRVPSVYRFIRGALHYSNGDIDKALADFESAVVSNPSYQLLRIWLAAAYAAAGRIDEAQWESGEILALDSGFSVSRAEQAFPILDPAYRERLMNDLRQAGLPD